MQEKIKEIAGVFLKIPAAQINAATVMDRSVVSSSILLHRMYGKLAAAGFVVKDYQDVRTFGDLLLQLEQPADAADAKPVSVVQTNEPSFQVPTDVVKESPGIGIDMERVDAMPVTNDFREDTFYTMNFSPAEIAYCILQPKPYVSFTGLFAAKEAIVKADNRFKKTNFNNIVIQHLPNGKPWYTGFNISISHTDDMAIAVAIPFKGHEPAAAAHSTGLPIKTANNIPAVVWLLILISVCLSVIALFLISKKV